jgi:acyl dehydratase
MTPGDRAEIRRTYTQTDIEDFAALTGAEATGHVPEPLIAALFSYLLGVRLPGSGTNYLKQDLAFAAPAPLGTELTASVEVTRVRPEKHLVDLHARCVLPDGTLVCEGRSLVKVRDVGA